MFAEIDPDRLTLDPARVEERITPKTTGILAVHVYGVAPPFLREVMGRSLLDLLDQLGTREDELKPLKAFERRGAYSAKYLALRANQGELPAIKEAGDWRTSARAHRIYREAVGRGVRGSAGIHGEPSAES